MTKISTADASRIDKAKLDEQVEKLLKENGGEVGVSLWLGGGGPGAWYELSSAEQRPAASAIKTFYLVELYTAFVDKLDGPVPGAEAILADAKHPALDVPAFSDKSTREQIHRVLDGASIREVGMVMMQARTLDGRETGNSAYNAAASLTTAVLGGPQALTTLIHKRDAAFEPVHVRRYMLADRKPGDNETSAATLAALYGRLSSRKLAGVNEKAMDAIHAALRKKEPAGLYAKDGSLSTDPLTKVEAGWWDTPKGPVIFVVMLEQAWPETEGREVANERLTKTAGALAKALSEAGIAALNK